MKKFVMLRSDILEDDIRYLELDELPSEFRFYDKNRVYVRGLNLLEIEALSQYTDIDINKDINQLVTIYKDVIKGIDIYDLEFIDFLMLVAISSVLTTNSMNWETELTCINLVPNTEKDKIDNEIKELKNKLRELTKEEEIEEIQNKIIELEEKKKELDDYVECGNILPPITLEDFEFKEPKQKDYIIKDNYKFGPVFIKDLVEFQQFDVKKYFPNIFKLKPDFDKEYLLPILYLKEVNGKTDIISKIKEVLINPNLLIELKNMENIFEIEQEPIIKICDKCGYENKIYIGLQNIKVYP